MNNVGDQKLYKIRMILLKTSPNRKFFIFYLNTEHELLIKHAENASNCSPITPNLLTTFLVFLITFSVFILSYFIILWIIWYTFYPVKPPTNIRGRYLLGSAWP